MTKFLYDITQRVPYLKTTKGTRKLEITLPQITASLRVDAPNGVTG